MARCALDHIVIAAATLDAGVAHLEERLGVTVPPGGAHPRMGTHNRLMRLGGRVYLEIIAIDPAAPAPSRPRWYDLDAPALQARIAACPQLVTWVVRTDDIEALAARSALPLGRIETVSRGDLTWRITVPENGSMPEGGLFPTLIEWPEGVEPSERLADLGCRLRTFRVRHADPARFEAALAAIGADDMVQVEPAGPDGPGLAADLEMPLGPVTLSSAEGAP